MQAASNRRQFLRQTSTLAAGLAALGPFNILRAGESPNRRIRLAVVGCNGRGMAHITNFLAQPDVEIAWICDVDSRAIEKGIAAVARKQATPPRGEKDLRRVLEDKSLDAISIATPNHWQASATILACQAGKHVYVEKPGSHTAHESELMVAAARKHRRVVQMGNQRRSYAGIAEAIERVRGGEIGKVFFCRTWYTSGRGSIGRGKPAPVPAWLDYDLWQGPAPARPFRDNVVHYNWHWFWHWGDGELGNNGIHVLDLARWGLNVDYPVRVTCGGQRYHFEDDQETPDTCVVTYDFGDKGATWECHSCHPRSFESAGTGAIFYGEKGSALIADRACKFCDLNDKVLAEIPGRPGDTSHFGNFLDAIRDGKPLRSEVGDCQKSTLLCHLGNIAWRTASTVNLDPKTHRIVGNRKAAGMWSREYRRGWEPKV